VTSVTATRARTNLFNILKNTIKGHTHTRITSKEGNAVLISEEDYESILETAELLEIPGLKSSLKKADAEIRQGKTFSIKDAFR
jgi:antitoxin YefM